LPRGGERQKKEQGLMEVLDKGETGREKERRVFFFFEKT